MHPRVALGHVRRALEAGRDRWLTEPVVGLDVGSAALKVVELRPDRDGVVLHRLGAAARTEAPLPEQVRALLRRAEMSTGRVVCGLASPEVVVRPFCFPRIPAAELPGAIRLQAEEAIVNGRTMEEVSVDWYLTAGGDEEVRGVVSVLPSALLQERVQLVRDAGLQPIVADVLGLAVWNAFWRLTGSQQTAPRTILLMNVGAATTNVVLVDTPDRLLLMRDLELGGDTLRRAGPEAAEWIREVCDSLRYARATSGLRGVDAVYVTGGGAEAVPPALSEAVGAPSVRWDPLERLRRGPEVHAPTEAHGAQFAAAIGLAMRWTG